MLNYKVSLWVLLLALLVAIGLSSYLSLTALHTLLLVEKKQQIKAQVDQAASAINYYQHLVETKQLTTEQAQQEAVDVVRNMRYGRDGYFWINDLNHQLIMHPYRSQLEGKSMYNFQDKEGVYVYREFVATAQSAQGGGYLLYYRARPRFEGNNEQLPKLSYVKRIEPWDWVVGTGVYIDDIDRIYEQQMNNQLTLWVLVMLGLLVVAFIGTLLWRNKAVSRD